jgi:hypothetical protein
MRGITSFSAIPCDPVLLWVSMKLAGFLLLLAGGGIAVSAIVLLKTAGAQTAFVLAGLAMEAAGLGIAFRCHLLPRRDPR